MKGVAMRMLKYLPFAKMLIIGSFLNSQAVVAMKDLRGTAHGLDYVDADYPVTEKDVEVDNLFRDWMKMPGHPGLTIEQQEENVKKALAVNKGELNPGTRAMVLGSAYSFESGILKDQIRASEKAKPDVNIPQNAEDELIESLRREYAKMVSDEHLESFSRVANICLTGPTFQEATHTRFGPHSFFHSNRLHKKYAGYAAAGLAAALVLAIIVYKGVHWYKATRKSQEKEEITKG